MVSNKINGHLYIQVFFGLLTLLIFQVPISLIGNFIFFFAIYALTYIYFKCFWKTTTASDGVRKARYKSLSFDAMEPHNPLHPETQGLVNKEFTYLTPVFSNNESRESRRTGEDGEEREMKTN